MDSKLNWLNAALIAVLLVAAVIVQTGYGQAMYPTDLSVAL